MLICSFKVNWREKCWLSAILRRQKTEIALFSLWHQLSGYKDGSVAYQAQVRIKRGGKLLLNESRSFLVTGVGVRAEAQAKRLAQEWGELLTESMRGNGCSAQVERLNS